jgi:hypothetical protein
LAAGRDSGGDDGATEAEGFLDSIIFSYVCRGDRAGTRDSDFTSTRDSDFTGTRDSDFFLLVVEFAKETVGVFTSTRDSDFTRTRYSDFFVLVMESKVKTGGDGCGRGREKKKVERYE